VLASWLVSAPCLLPQVEPLLQRVSADDHATVGEMHDPNAFGTSDVLIGRMQDRGSWVLRCDSRDVARGNGLAIDESPTLDIKAEPDGLALRCPPAGVHELEMRFV
jgi:hypothetical protein